MDNGHVFILIFIKNGYFGAFKKEEKKKEFFGTNKGDFWRILIMWKR